MPQTTAMRSMKTVKRLILIFFGLGLSLIVLLFLVFGRSRPSDAELVQSFNQHRATYEELKRMFEADVQLDGVAPYGLRSTNRVLWASPSEAGISKERFQVYLGLLDRAEAKVILKDEAGIWFATHASGFASKGYRIGVGWTEQVPSPLIASLDDFRKTTNRWEHAYRTLGDGWYLSIVW
jgi:hypothetical protein